jgi:hypothetical protein
MLSRRDLIGKVAASGAVIAVAGAARASTSPLTGTGPSVELGTVANGAKPAVAADAPDTALAEAPWELLRPLTPGADVGNGWHVAGLTGAVDGTCVLTLQNERGRAHRIHLCRNGGSPQGIVYTDHIDLLVMNGGEGDLATDEGFAQAVAKVAHVIAANEPKQTTVVASLMPHQERLRRFAGADHRLR